MLLVGKLVYLWCFCRFCSCCVTICGSLCKGILFVKSFWLRSYLNVSTRPTVGYQIIMVYLGADYHIYTNKYIQMQMFFFVFCVYIIIIESVCCFLLETNDSHSENSIHYSLSSLFIPHTFIHFHWCIPNPL